MIMIKDKDNVVWTKEENNKFVQTRWKYFITLDGTKHTKAILDGGFVHKRLEDIEFELKILDDGRLMVQIGDTWSRSFKHEKPTMIRMARKVISEKVKKDMADFYIPVKMKFAKLVYKPIAIYEK